ncbi:MAG TPA: 50S ribosomal protein L18 [Candidatus Dormibacteraeota bacterium]|nr:50S ribosomal protein L18 [Candidatus Dormibacteraeota bacterium]
MGSVTRLRRDSRLKRHRRVRKHVRGLTERPRLSVSRSLNHISAQVIDDIAGRTLAAASSSEADLRKAQKSTAGMAAAEAVGKAVAERARKAGISLVVFDRGGYIYHGRVKALAEAARSAGLEF